ncbi:poly(ADP-ribose) glycohydrolase-like [Microplitis mediator]|uniref:poly(ADP-ribose) glycohydrolase-like n=1 Tax=Microplitis mediator TaxID=375433 RepID=UPI002552D7E5|nr:poly(ADP-ribose) glycohydrolase-like [Microplitis mediator]XP_057337110.1 poly(ADP-ribose) glycohydrolase-like [Microplitis mediator]XP_057337111.1 poly(ADP-ribose) glycohydrolase-like [Microplitis mediator]XP_057337112.1 poly(ADP-ribose) glycohydrolase-like [Microplitis mediator]
MAESTSSVAPVDQDINEPMSPDIFSDCEAQDSGPPDTGESCPAELNEPQWADDTPEWKGVSMDEIYKGLGPFGYQQQPPIRPSEHHTVLFQLPIPNRGQPKPYPSQPVDKWCTDYVRMPHSPQSLYPVEKGDNKCDFRVRWEVIQEALLQRLVSSLQLEAAILSYKSKYIPKWNFNALHYFFENLMDKESTEMFFDKLFPKMVQLALQLPTLIIGPIPLLKQHSNNSISLSQLQVASLLANAFFCTFPCRNSVESNTEYATFPFINFNGLFSAYPGEKLSTVTEKLKCLFHYFQRVTTSAPEGTITIRRRFISKDNCPKWDKANCPLPSLHITSKGTIETDGIGLLQVDFANKYVGGGVLNRGCVQEEIRFVICPELLVTMLVTEELDDTEALIITGVERYSNYVGYSYSFKWDGNFVDETPRDSSGRRQTTVVAIDALYFTQAEKQFYGRNIIRELNKAYVGFSSVEIPERNLSAIATGKWGCGAFRGNPQLKVLIQLMAAAVSQRPVVCYTFGDNQLRDCISDMYWHLINHNISVARLFAILRQYGRQSAPNHLYFYQFLYHHAQIKPLTSYFKVLLQKLTHPTNNPQIKSPKKSESTELLAITAKKLSIQKKKPPDVEEEEKIQNLLDDDDIGHDKLDNTGTKNISKHIEVDSTVKTQTPEQKWDTWKSKLKCQQTKLVDDNSTHTKETIGNKKSLWDIIAENKNEEDRFRVEPTKKRLTGLEALYKNELLTDDDSSDSCSEQVENVTESKNFKKPENIKQDLHSPVSEKVDDINKSSSNLNTVNNCKVKKSPSPEKSNVLETGQKKILDYFSRKN